MKAVVPPTSVGLRASVPPTAATASASGLCGSSSSSGNFARLPIGYLVVELDDVSLVLRRGAGRSGHWQADRDHGPLARRAFNHHGAFVQLDQPLHQRQAEAGAVMLAGVVVADLRERAAETAKVLFLDAD